MISDINETVKLTANLMLQGDNPDYKNAFAQFKLAAVEGGDAEAQYIIGNYYATGTGVEKNYLLAAYWLNKAALQGWKNAQLYKSKATWDYFNENANLQTAKDIFEAAVKYCKTVDNTDDIERINDILSDIMCNFMKHENYDCSFKYCEAMAVWGNCSEGQNNLAIHYLNGLGTSKNDLAALYWFDVASDQQNEGAKKHKDGLFNAYLTNLGKQETKEQLEILSSWCTVGTKEVPENNSKRLYWEDVKNSL